MALRKNYTQHSIKIIILAIPWLRGQVALLY